MIKNPARDSFVAALRFYARLGERNADTIRDKIYSIESNQKATNNLQIELGEVRAYKTLKALETELFDIECVEKTLSRLEEVKGEIAVRAVKAVYMTNPNKKLKAMDITTRVDKAALELFVDSSTVNRYIAVAREIYADYHKIRTTEELLKYIGHFE